MYTLTTYNKFQSWDPMLAAAAMSVLHVIHDDQLYLNGLDAYTLCAVHEQNSVVARHKRTNHTCAVQHIT